MVLTPVISKPFPSLKCCLVTFCLLLSVVAQVTAKDIPDKYDLVHYTQLHSFNLVLVVLLSVALS